MSYPCATISKWYCYHLRSSITGYWIIQWTRVSHSYWLVQVCSLHVFFPSLTAFIPFDTTCRQSEIRAYNMFNPTEQRGINTIIGSTSLRYHTLRTETRKLTCAFPYLLCFNVLYTAYTYLTTVQLSKCRLS